MLTRNHIVFIMLISALGLFSCVPVKRISYVQSKDQTIFHGEPADIKIRPGDEIFIRITSADDAPTVFGPDAQRNLQDARLLSYTVNDEGKIKLPYIGRIKVSEMSLDSASDHIEEMLGQFLYMPNVFMRFVNTKVTVLGEVNRPGVYMFDYKNVNILHAIGFAGDISVYGNRKNVLIIREEGGKRTKHYVDLTRGSILESELYNLQSGDVVFIEPLGRKKWGLAQVPYNLIFTVITTGIFVYTFFQNNINN